MHWKSCSSIWENEKDLEEENISLYFTHYFACIYVIVFCTAVTL